MFFDLFLIVKVNSFAGKFWCCAARGHALAIWLRLAPSALAPLGLRSAAKCAPRRATHQP